MPKVTFIGGPDEPKTLEAKTGTNLLVLAEEHHIKMGSACGGVCACSSCHCWIREGLSSLKEATEAAEDRLDMGFDVRSYSRLGCQTEVGEDDIVVELTEESLQTWYNEHPGESRDDKPAT